MSRLIKIEIANWKKYHPRQVRDLKKPWWFALSNEVTEDPETWELTDAEFRCWIALLCYASKKKRGSFMLPVNGFCEKNKLKLSTVMKMLHKAALSDWINFIMQESCVFPAVKTPAHNKTIQDNTICSEQRYRVFGTGNKNYQVLKSLVAQWHKTYGEGWVEGEIKSALCWCQENARRAPKSDFGKFMGSWLRRGWEQHRKTLTKPKAQGGNQYGF